MGVTESEWRPPSGEPGEAEPRPAPDSWTAPGNDAASPGDAAAPKPLPGAMGPPRLGPPPRLGAQPQFRPPPIVHRPVGPPPAMPMPMPVPMPPGPPRIYPPNGVPRTGPVPTGAWQGALRPPVFVVNQATRHAERPVYREPQPVRGGRVAAGAGVAALWMLLFGVQAGTARAYAWLTIVAAVIAWCAIAVLARFGDRGAAVGAAAATGVGLAIAGLVVGIQAIGGHWLLW